MQDPTDRPDSEWQRKGATLSNKTAREEFGLTDAQIHAAIRGGALQYRVGSMFGNPFLRLLRREVEELMTKSRGSANLKEQQAKTEVGRVDREIRGLKRKLVALEKRRAELVGGPSPPPPRRPRRK